MTLPSGARVWASIVLEPRRAKSRIVTWQVLRTSGLFDPVYYLKDNPDVAAKGRDPLWHYVVVGESELRNPNPFFDVAYYLVNHPELARAGDNALRHFYDTGGFDGSPPSPRFDPAYYLSSYPDVAASGMNPLSHYLRFGRAERRVAVRSTTAGSAAAENPMTRHDLYDERFYDSIADVVRSSAGEIVPLVLSLTGARSVADVGCGRGIWLSTFRDHGIEDFVGIDGDHIDPMSLEIPESRFIAADLELSFTLDRRFDLAVSLEVAEHLKETVAAGFVSSLTKLADVVLFSAAIPFQGGVGHINEQWPDYWVSLFAEHGYGVVDAVRPMVWGNRKVGMWYAQNCLLFVSGQVLTRSPALQEAHAMTRTGQLALVHPSLFLLHRLQQSGRIAGAEPHPPPTATDPSP